MLSVFGDYHLILRSKIPKRHQSAKFLSKRNCWESISFAGVIDDPSVMIYGIGDDDQGEL